MTSHDEEQGIEMKANDNIAAPPPTTIVVEEPDYSNNSGTSGSFLNDAQPDDCCTRCGGEWRGGWFGIQEGPRTLDIPASFGPQGLLVIVAKCSLLGVTLGTLIYKWVDRYSGDLAKIFLIFLTHWSLILGSLWLIISTLNSLFPPKQPLKPSNDSVSLWIKFLWLMFEVAAHFNMIVVILYWLLVHDEDAELNYINLFEHLFILPVVWFDGLVINRIPVRWKHLPLPMFMASCYVLWLVIHQLKTDIGVPNKTDNDPDTNDDLIYTAVDFENKTVFSIVLALIVVFVAVPLQHLTLWGLSLYSFPCGCSGNNRRYLSVKQQDATQSSMDNVNIYEQP